MLLGYLMKKWRINRFRYWCNYKKVWTQILTIKKWQRNVECLCYGGGVKTVDHAEHIISLGVEKVAVSSGFIANPNLVTDISSKIGGPECSGYSCC